MLFDIKLMRKKKPR